MQKYLSPTDRDEIALTLNLSNAQVITWFQVSSPIQSQIVGYKYQTYGKLYLTCFSSFQFYR